MNTIFYFILMALFTTQDIFISIMSMWKKIVRMCLHVCGKIECVKQSVIFFSKIA